MLDPVLIVIEKTKRTRCKHVGKADEGKVGTGGGRQGEGNVPRKPEPNEVGQPVNSAEGGRSQVHKLKVFLNYMVNTVPA